ncbi:MAG: cytochrome c [Granulosicoccus sp.]|nr:cytochrome c [Granulosicoccus sp.]
MKLELCTKPARSGSRASEISVFKTQCGLRSYARSGLPLVVASLFLFLASALTVAHAEGDPSAGARKAYTCLGCHGIKHYVNTYPTYHVPKIAGQHEAYLVAALQAYKNKSRSHPTMQANANLLSEQDIQDIAAWFASQGVSSK